MFTREIRLGLLVLSLLFAAQLFAEGGAAAPPATPPVKPPATAKPPVREAPKHEFLAYADELKLTPDQVTKINDKVQAMQKANADWNTANKEQYNKILTDLRAKEKDKDAAGAAPLRAQLQAMDADRLKIENGLKKELYDVLTLDQKLTWAGIRMYRDREYGTMVKVCGLSADQDAKLKELAKTSGGALAKWDMENSEKVKQLEKQKAEIQAELDALRGPRDKITQEQTTQFNAIITPQQQVAWRSYRLQGEMSGRFAKAKLTDDQQAKVRALCDQAAADMLAKPSDGQAILKIYETLNKTINEQVLTPEQRAALTAKPEPAAGGGR